MHFSKAILASALALSASAAPLDTSGGNVLNLCADIGSCTY